MTKPVPPRAEELPAQEPLDAALARNRRFQERYWRIERIAWLGFLALVVTALLGLTGSGGPLSRTEIESPAGTVQFPRIVRWSSADQISFRFAPGGPEREILLSRAFFHVFQIDAMMPEPARSKAVAEGLALTFAAEPDAPVQVELHVRPRQPGFARFAARLDGGPPLDLFILVLP
jgi:hypothetical protein